MRVIDLSNTEVFISVCQDFKRELDARIPCPDLVVGIATGGQRVVEAMGYVSIPILFVKRQRRTTKLKARLPVRMLVTRLPRYVRDYLRLFEIWLRECRFELSRKRLEVGSVAEISSRGGDHVSPKQILIIDDAVDSGATFVDVRRFIESRYPKAHVASAALCRTFSAPAYDVDYVFFDRAMLRCPWAIDASKVNA